MYFCIAVQYDAKVVFTIPEPDLLSVCLSCPAHITGDIMSYGLVWKSVVMGEPLELCKEVFFSLQVISKGQEVGPSGVIVNLYKSGSTDVLQTATTKEDGR